MDSFGCGNLFPSFSILRLEGDSNFSVRAAAQFDRAAVTSDLLVHAAVQVDLLGHATIPFDLLVRAALQFESPIRAALKYFTADIHQTMCPSHSHKRCPRIFMDQSQDSVQRMSILQSANIVIRSRPFSFLCPVIPRIGKQTLIAQMHS